MIQQIEVTFPCLVEFSQEDRSKLIDLISEVCKRYEKEHPDRVMWPAGQGSKILWREPQEPDFDDSVFCIDVSERENYKYLGELKSDKKSSL